MHRARQGEISTLSLDLDTRLGSFHLRPRLSAGRGLLALFGHSGSGKSLTLRAIAGLLHPERGCITLNGVPVFDAARGIDVPPQGRGVGLVMQQYALFPHLTVRENIAYGLAHHRRAERDRLVDELIALLGLESLADRRPARISGGQAQRVALARALAPGPRLLLLDEPFSALDTAIRVDLRRELMRLKRELDLTIVFVTHDLREAYNLADSIAVFDDGAVLQLGTRDEVFNRPVSARVAMLTEVRNVWQGRVVGGDGDIVTVDIGAARLNARVPPALGVRVGVDVAVCIRPERVVLQRGERGVGMTSPPQVRINATIVDEVAHGATHTLYFRFNGAAVGRNGHDVEVDLPALPYEVLGVRHTREWTLYFPLDVVHLMNG